MLCPCPESIAQRELGHCGLEWCRGLPKGSGWREAVPCSLSSWGHPGLGEMLAGSPVLPLGRRPLPQGTDRGVWGQRGMPDEEKGVFGGCPFQGKTRVFEGRGLRGRGVFKGRHGDRRGGREPFPGTSDRRLRP